MSLADEWDAIPTSGTATAAPSDTASLWDAIPAKAAQPSEQKATTDIGQKYDESATRINAAIKHAVTGVGASIYGGWRGLAKLATGGSLEDAANAVQDAQRKYTWNGDTSTQQSAVNGFDSSGNPLNWFGVAGQKAGDYVMDKTGSPAAATAMDTGINAAGFLFGKKAVGKSVISDVNPSVLEAIQPKSGAPVVAPDVAAKPRFKLNTDGTATPIEQQPQSAPSPQASNSTAQPNTASAPALELPLAEQQQRAQVLNEIGLQNVRKSVITGNPKAAATDFQTSAVDGPAGNLMKSKFIEERQALENYADDTVRNTGGTVGADQKALYGRGNTIMAPLDALKDWFDTRISDLYKAADDRSQGVPTTLDRFRDVLSDDSEMTNQDRVHLRGAVNAYAKKLGILGEDGSIAGNAQQAETVRKYLNDNWSPQNNKFVAKLKDALDDDVTSAAGEDIYSQARQMRALRGATLDDPKGIAKVMDASGPQGINRAVPVEKLADALTSMPADQLGHVIKTLQNVPQEIQPQAKAAIAEIKAHFANNIADAGRSTKGQWNSKAVDSYLANNAERLSRVFEPEELSRFDTLSKAGKILATDQRYPGAAVQQHNLLRSGMMAAVKGAATSGGAAVGGAPGAWVGSVVGDKVAGRIGDASALKAAQKRLVPLSSFLGGK